MAAESRSSFKRLRPVDAEILIALRREALETDPLAFSASLADDVGLALDHVRAALADDQGQAVFGCLDGTRLVGIVGIVRAAKVKQRHTAQVWGMYVTPGARERGIGRRLLAAAIEHARRWPGVEQVHLSVTDSAAVARHLYETAGFREWGHAARALACDGRFVGESHLVLDLEQGCEAPPRTASVRLGVVILPEFPWGAARPLWRRAEELGFEHVWTYDHIAWRSLRDKPWFGAIATLVAAATATERVRLGTLVASPNFRHPVPFARDLIALDDVSRGRFTLGIGAGGEGWDATVLGQAAWSPQERGARFLEFVDLTDRLLRQPVTSYRGSYYSANEAPMSPGCVQRPRIPFAIAATRPRGMKLVATHAHTWVTIGARGSERPLPAAAGAQVVKEQMERLDEACALVGRDPASLKRLVLTGPCLEEGLDSLDAFRDTVGHYVAAGVTDLVVHWPRRDEPYAGDLETFERIISLTIPSRVGHAE